MNISLRQLKAFVMLAKVENFSRAAERLHIAQSGLSMMVRELEGQLGFRLFDRSTRKVALTSLGQEFLMVAEQNIKSVESFVSQAARTSKEAATVLTIGAPPMACAHLLPDIVLAFRTRHPNVQLKIMDVQLGRITDMVLSGEVDLGLGMFVKPTPGLTRRSLFKYSVMVASRAEKFQVARTPCTWQELANKPFISLPSDAPFQQTVDLHLAHAGHVMPPRMTVNYIETQIGMAVAGSGYAIIPTTANAACKGRPVRLQSIIEPAVELDYFELRDRARSLPACADEFSSLFSERISRFAVLKRQLAGT